jgi:hypothetical protein
LELTDSVEEARDILVDCYRTHSAPNWKRSVRARLNGVPTTTMAKAPGPRNADGQEVSGAEFSGP